MSRPVIIRIRLKNGGYRFISPNYGLNVESSDREFLVQKCTSLKEEVMVRKMFRIIDKDEGTAVTKYDAAVSNESAARCLAWLMKK